MADLDFKIGFTLRHIGPPSFFPVSSFDVTTRSHCIVANIIHRIVPSTIIPDIIPFVI
jgi:hypothetical protein